MFLHLILLIVFSIMAIFGLIFNVYEGVFVGAALIPWEARMILAARGKVNSRLVILLLAISALIGGGYFILHQVWSRALILLGVQGYIYLVINRSKAKLEKAEERAKDGSLKK